MPPLLKAVFLGILPTTVFAFAPPATNQVRVLGVLHSSSINKNYQNLDDDFFDPFLQSPHSFGSNGDNSSEDVSSIGTISTGSTFGFNTGVIKNPESPSSNDGFDPLLSPHAYANGVDAGPVADDAATVTPIIATRKLGILLIDHGSRRQASNDHIHEVARMYENRLNLKNDNVRGDTTVTIVRAAHMEISRPSIMDSLRDIVTMDKVTKIVCVPYFLSPGRHATEDVPTLIEEAKGELAEEGFSVDIVVSDAIGTHLESMLGAVDDLVGWTLNNEGGRCVHS